MKIMIDTVNCVCATLFTLLFIWVFIIVMFSDQAL